MLSWWASNKRLLIGSPIPTSEHERQLLPKVLALPVFSSDCLSSVAYATEEVVLVLALGGVLAFKFVTPVTIAIAILMVIVVVSYRQTVRAYPSGGGAFIVAHDNLGMGPAKVAAASLLTDYVLTVAVSISAGVAAITSAAPGMLQYRVPIALGFVVLLTLANLRGARESSALFAAPTYAFVLIVMGTLAIGFGRCVIGSCPQAVSAGVGVGEATSAITLFLVLRAFASGASALTGVEAIANGVQAFKPPKSHNAATTLGMMGAIAVTMFLGIGILAHLFNVQVGEGTVDKYGTVLSQIGRAVFNGTGAGFIALQVVTAAILVLGANTAYQDFPRLSAILASHRLMPRQYRSRGDRLAYSNGIVTVALFASALIIGFGAQVSRLIQLYVVGVFTSFTLSQTGMVRHWLRSREKGWKHSVVINAVGAFATGVVLIVVAVVKFRHGAWIILVAVPFFVAGMSGLRRHYMWVASQLRQAPSIDGEVKQHRVIVLAAHLGYHLNRAFAFARLLHPDRLEVWHVREPGDEQLLSHMREAHPDVPFMILRPDQGGVSGTLRKHLHEARNRDPGTLLTVVVAERVGLQRWRYAFSHRKAPSILWALRREDGIATVDLNYRVGAGRRRKQREALVQPQSKRLVWMSGTNLEIGSREVPPKKVISVVLVSEVTAPTMNAVAYARTVSPDQVHALHIEMEPEQRERVEAAWLARDPGMPLEIVESPYRELTEPVLRYVEDMADRAEEGTIINVVIPEFVIPTLAGSLLHNQSAIWIRLALYADTRVAVTAVPWVLQRAPEPAPAS
jgi:amino acid transporter